MKLLLERWNKFVNEAEEKSSSKSYREMLDLIKGEDGSEQLRKTLFRLITESFQITST